MMRDVNIPFVLSWSLPETWDVFAENGIGFGMLSNPIPGGIFGSARQADSFVTAVNESTAELRDEYPGSFGFLAAVPMPYLDQSLNQLSYAFDTLHADGVVLIPQSGGNYLGTAAYEPLLDELDRRAAVVLVHPLMLPGGHHTEPPSVLADFLQRCGVRIGVYAFGELPNEITLAPSEVIGEPEPNALVPSG